MMGSMKIRIVTGFILLLVAALVSLLLLSQKQKSTTEPSKEVFKSAYAVTHVPLPDTLSVAGESVPMDIWYVKESLERELLVNVYWQSNTLLMIKRASRWLPEIKQTFRQMGVPEDLAFLALVESALTGTTSPAGAEGHWQFLESTAKSYGLVINDEVDERYHLQKATRAAGLYLQAAYGRFGSWVLAAAAYNRGMEGLSKAISQQGENNFFKLWLNQETSRYIYRLLAIKLILEHPADYGFYLKHADLYPPIASDLIRIDTLINDLPAFAHSQGISFRTLKEYNPWLKKYSLNGSVRTYELAIPKGRKLSYPDDWGDKQEGYFNGNY
jgi:membrane-bound lytic murein transglycosylase D